MRIETAIKQLTNRRPFASAYIKRRRGFYLVSVHERANNLFERILRGSLAVLGCGRELGEDLRMVKCAVKVYWYVSQVRPFIAPNHFGTMTGILTMRTFGSRGGTSEKPLLYH